MEQRIIDTSEVTLLQPEYVGIEKVLRCFIELTTLGIDKKVVEECMQNVFRPTYIISTEKLKYEHPS